jgi:phasin family protein
MYAVNEYFADFNKSSVEQATKIANVTFMGIEQLINLNLSSAKSAFEVSTKNFKALSEITDVQDLVSFRTKATEAGVEGALSYSRDAYEVLSGTQAEVSKLVEAGIATMNKNLASVVDKAVKSAPAGSDVAVTALKSTMAATSAAIESMTKATRQVVDFTDASVRAASAKAATVATSAAKTPARKAA